MEKNVMSRDDATARPGGTTLAGGHAPRRTPAPGEPPLDLAAFHAGSAEAIRRIYLEHGAALLRDLRRHTGSAEAESVVHDVFVELLRNQDLRSRFLGGTMRAWLRQIGRMKCLEHLRRARPRDGREWADGQASPEPELEARDLLRRLLTDVVPPKQRDFFRLRFLETHTQVEVAARLRIPRSTLEGWEHRLSERLRELILD
jgi:RNA polymerase sigma factor (sigma-70 family)